VTFKAIPVTTYALTPSAGANGNISPSTAQTVNAGDSKTFTFSPNLGYEVNEVKVDGSAVSVTGNNYTFSNVQSNHTINVTFKTTTTTTYTLTVLGGTGSGSYIAGSTVFIMADIAPLGQVFDRWVSSSGSFANVNDANTEFAMPSSNVTVTATYKDDIPDGMEKVKNKGPSVWVVGNYLYLSSDKDGIAQIYAVSGQLVKVVSYHIGENIVYLPAGWYIVRTEKFSFKVVVR
jgi:hypothetical protein